MKKFAKTVYIKLNVNLNRSLKSQRLITVFRISTELRISKIKVEVNRLISSKTTSLHLQFIIVKCKHHIGNIFNRFKCFTNCSVYRSWQTGVFTVHRKKITRRRNDSSLNRVSDRTSFNENDRKQLNKIYENVKELVEEVHELRIELDAH